LSTSVDSTNETSKSTHLSTIKRQRQGHKKRGHTSKKNIIMLPSRIGCIDVAQRIQMRERCHLGKAPGVPRTKGPDSVLDARVAMKKHIEILYKKKILRPSSQCSIPTVKERQAIDENVFHASNSSPTEFQVIGFVTVVERLLFASARSLEEYEDPSTLDKRLRYIIIRFLKRKLRVEIHRRRCVAAALAKGELIGKEIIGLSKINDTFQGLSIGSVATSQSGL